MRKGTLAVGAAVLLGLLASASMGAVVVDLRFTDGTTTKVLGAADAGTTITIQLWAQVTGAVDNPKKEGVGFIYAAAKSVQGATGILIGGAGVGFIDYANDYYFKPAAGSQKGAVGNLSADSIQDWGSVTTMASAIKAASVNGGASPIYSTSYAPGDADKWEDITNGTEFLLGTFSFKIGSINMMAGLTGETKLVCAKPTWSPTNTYHNTFKDETSDTLPANYTVGSGVRFIIPEPATVALIMAGAVGLLVRRRRFR